MPVANNNTEGINTAQQANQEVTPPMSSAQAMKAIDDYYAANQMQKDTTPEKAKEVLNHLENMPEVMHLNETQLRTVNGLRAQIIRTMNPDITSKKEMNKEISNAQKRFKRKIDKARKQNSVGNESQSKEPKPKRTKKGKGIGI